MNKEKIKLSTPEMVSGFINVCSKYEYDINLYDGSIVIDAKSIISVLSVQQGKEVEVEIVSDDECVILSFVEDMRKFEV